MILFEKYKNNNQHSSGFGKYYGRVKMIETVEIEKIAKYMQESCTVTSRSSLPMPSGLPCISASARSCHQN